MTSFFPQWYEWIWATKTWSTIRIDTPLSYYYLYCYVPGSPCLSKKGIKCTVRFFFKFCIGSYGQNSQIRCSTCIRPRVLSLLGAQGGFVGDPTSLARDNIYIYMYFNISVIHYSDIWFEKWDEF